MSKNTFRLSLALTVVASSAANAGFDQYAITDLGSIVADPASPNDYSYPFDINDRGDIVGFSRGADGLDHAFVRLRGQTLTDLGEGRATSINNHRHFVGRNGGSNYVMWKPGPLGYGVTDLGVLNAGTTGWGNEQSIKINEMDEIAGTGSGPAFFFWKNGMLTDLGIGDGNFCAIEGNIGFNNRSDITYSVGGYYQGSIQTEVGLPMNPINSYTYLYSVNDAQEMVGLAKTGFGGGGAYYSAATGFKNLPALATGPRALSDINNAGIAVGGGNYPVYSGNDPTLQRDIRAYVYSPADDSYVYLDTLIPEFQANPASQWNLKLATAINDAGQIVGVGINPQGKTHGFLLTPIVQP